MADLPESNLAAAIVDIARDLARTVPAPRGAPYFCLDSDAAYDLSVLESFCARGIFRKYEFALDLGSGLGGRARWLAARSGCRVVGVDPYPAVVRAAMLLNQRARMDTQVTFQTGRLETLPLRARIFTHVWLVDLDAAPALTAICREGYRVLRPGGHFAMQGAATPRARPAAIVEMLRSIGFINLEMRDVECVETPSQCRVARDRLRALLQPSETAPVPPPMAVQIFATRPA